MGDEIIWNDRGMDFVNLCIMNVTCNRHPGSRNMCPHIVVLNQPVKWSTWPDVSCFCDVQHFADWGRYVLIQAQMRAIFLSRIPYTWYLYLLPPSVLCCPAPIAGFWVLPFLCERGKKGTATLRADWRVDQLEFGWGMGGQTELHAKI